LPSSCQEGEQKEPLDQGNCPWRR